MWYLFFNNLLQLICTFNKTSLKYHFDIQPPNALGGFFIPQKERFP